MVEAAYVSEILRHACRGEIEIGKESIEIYDRLLVSVHYCSKCKNYIYNYAGIQIESQNFNNKFKGIVKILNKDSIKHIKKERNSA